MELLGRYLQAVGNYLPRKRRDDILAELRANMLEQAEDKEAELGRPLTLDEEETLLKQYGRPLLVATRYLPQQHLIGPTVFPYYLFALKALLPLVALLYTVVNAVVFINEPVTAGRLVGMLFGFPAFAFSFVVWLTVAAVIVEFTQARLLKSVIGDWSPRTLPALETKPAHHRTHSIFEVILSGLFILWLLAVPQSPFLWLGPGVVVLKYVQPAPVWHNVYWAFVALMLAQWLIEMVALFHAGFRRVRPALGLVGKCLTAALFWYVLRAPQLFTVTDAGRALPQYQEMADSLNRGLAIGLRVALVFLFLHVLWEAFRLVQGRSHSAISSDFVAHI